MSKDTTVIEVNGVKLVEVDLYDGLVVPDMDDFELISLEPKP